jgi:NAD-dependent deacetylase
MSVVIPSDLIQTFQQARYVVALTGAGVSKESGIPTFRDAEKGLWSQFNSEDLATWQGFQKNPERVSRWYDERRIRCRSAQPNGAHVALAQLEQILVSKNSQFMLLTQNIDRLHQRAGSQNWVELHGSLDVWWCLQCEKETEEGPEPFSHYPVTCKCGGMKRPSVVWFGEELPIEALRLSFSALRQCDLFLTIGTSSLVQPASGFLYLAKEHGAKSVEINLETTAHSHLVDWNLKASAGEILPRLLKEVFDR